MAFRGFPPEAIRFFEGLELDNSKSYWTANKDVYERAVRGPMEELVEAVDDRFKPFKIFRPYRDVRFSADKTPYKTECAAASERQGGATHYLALSCSGLTAATGYYAMAKDQLARFRDVVDDERTGGQIADIVAALEEKGFLIGGVGQLKSAPRGYPRDHPRVDLLRRKGLATWRSWPVASWLHTAKAKDRIEDAWATGDVLNDWLDANVGPSELPPDERSIH